MGEELDIEEQEELDEKLLDVGPARLPDVPRAEPAKPQAAKAKNAIQRAQLEDLSEELTNEAVTQLETTKAI